MKSRLGLETIRSLGFIHAVRVLSFRLGLGNESIRKFLDDVQVPGGRFLEAPAAILAYKSERLPLFQKPGFVSGEPVGIDEISGFPIVTISGGKLFFGYDLWLEIGSLLADSRDLGRVSRGGQISAEPAADAQIGIILDWLLETHGLVRNGHPWPANGLFALGLSHDIDRVKKTFQYATHAVRHVRNRNFRQAMKSAIPRATAYWGFPEIRRIENERHVRSTFFVLPGESDARSGKLRQRVLGWGGSRFDSKPLMNALRELRLSGWEIGLHNSISSRAQLEGLLSERKKLDAILGMHVTGVRQHYLSFNVPSLWLPQARAGFLYDTSMGFSDRIGFRAGTCYPYETAVSGLWELPFEIMDGALFPDPSHAWESCLSLLTRVSNLQGSLVVNWHQRFFDSFDFPGFREFYTHLIDEAVKLGAWVAPCGQIVEEWRRRAT